MKECGIYKIVNTSNGRTYIGSSIDLNARWRNHLSKLKNNKHCNSFLQNDFNKCQVSDFLYVILETCKEDDLIVKEQSYIDLNYDNQIHCYNLRRRAESNRGWKHAAETKKRMRQARKENKPSQSCIDASILARTGTKASKETCQKMSDYQKNRTEEHREKLGKAFKARWEDPVSRQKLIESQKNKFKNGYVHPGKKSVKQLTRNMVEVARYASCKEASLKTGIVDNCISRAAAGKRKSAGGYFWKYV